ncbi:T9SS type A sorting domain-containing protein [Thalassobellus sediminis]|uniref:T9SS type A sorting domain-containing protein n=1 Tax=Thalassobellus sediminis TaxID=3367753 RepID=UPI0037A2D6B3
MKKQITLLILMLFVALVSTQMEAQAKKVLYLANGAQETYNGGFTTSAPGDDAITRMLDADVNFEITTTGRIDGGGAILGGDPEAAITDLSVYDLIICQESISSGSAAWSSAATGGPLALKNLTVPVIFCKNEAFRNGKAITDADAGIAKNKKDLSVTVPVVNQSHELFNGIDFSAGGDVEIKLFLETANGNGTNGNDGLKILNNLDMSSAAAGTLATTAEVIDPAEAIVINHIPAGTELGEDSTDKASVDIVVFGFSYGVQVRGDGANITSEALTIWRNAAYKLTGLTVPTTLYVNTEAAKQLLYLNQVGVGQGVDASAPGQDPVINMLINDPNFFVTYTETASDGSGVPDLSNFDLVVAQETFSSGGALFQPGGVLGVKDVTIPIIYNKTWAFRDGKAVTDTDAAVTGTQNLSVTVDPSNQSHGLFSGIDFSGGNDIRIFKAATASDDGTAGGGNKAIDILNDLDIAPAAGSLATVPEVTDAAKAFVINYLPSGTQLGEAATDKLTVDAVALSFSYGAMIMGDGANISPEALTIWRNAAYVLTGQTTPTNVVANGAYFIPKKVLYLNQAGVGQGAGASAPGADPVINMLIADQNFDVTYFEAMADGSDVPDLSGFDLVIAQETFSSGGAIFQPGGALGIKDVTIPIIYNKTWAFRDGKAVTDNDATVTGTQNVSVTAVNPLNPLFSGIDLSGGNDIRIFSSATANDDGSIGGNKGIDVLNNLDISSAAAGAAATVPEVTDAAQSFVINYLPAGTSFGTSGTDVLTVNAVAFSFSYGAMVMGDGANISPEALTIWRNAAYWLTFGPTEVPTTLVANPDFVLGVDKVGEASKVSSNIKAIGSRVYLSNVKSKTEVNIYSISGALVKTFKTNEDTNFEFKSGLWIATVKTFEGEKAVKFITK